MEQETVLEGMTSVRGVIKGRDAGVNDRHIFKILIDRERSGKRAADIKWLRSVSGKHDFTIEFTDSETISEMTGGRTHGGVAAVCSGRTLPPVTEDNIDGSGFYCMLCGIEDPFNFGQSLRSLYASGCRGAVVSERNWMSAAGTVARSSAGTSEMLPVYMSGPEAAVDVFRNKGYKIVSAGIRDSVSSFDADLRCPLLLVAGGEKRGIPSSVGKLSDLTVRIDYGREFRGSLPTASAVSVLSYEILRQNKNNL